MATSAVSVRPDVFMPGAIPLWVFGPWRTVLKQWEALPRRVHATVWFDGACSGNPGPMGAGAVVEVDGDRKVLSQAMGRGTNNEAEYHALILGLLHALAAGADEVTVRGDSQLVLRQLTGQYRMRAENLKPLLADARQALARFRRHTVEWVPREENTLADEASKKAIGLA